MQARNGAEPILEVRNLKTHFFTDKGVVKAVKGVSFSLANKQTLGIVGESGCGKSVTAHSIMQLIKSPPGEIVFRRQKRRAETIDIVQLDPKGVEMRSIRGGEISMIFQEPMTSLESAAHGRPPDRGSGGIASKSRQERRAESGDRNARSRAHCRSARTGEAVSASIERWYRIAGQSEHRQKLPHIFTYKVALIKKYDILSQLSQNISNLMTSSVIRKTHVQED